MNKVYFQSSTQMQQIADNSIDLVITSPPYWNCKEYGDNPKDVANQATYQDYLTALLQTWKECERVLKPNGKLCINVPLLPIPKKQDNSHHNRTIYDLQSDIQQNIKQGTGLYLLDLYVWERTNSQKKLMFGSYPYPRNFYNNNICEFIVIFVKEGKPSKIPKEQKEKSKLSEQEWLEYTKQVWKIPAPNKKDLGYGISPALMPEELAKRLIKLFTLEGDVVLDPFAGSGTTLAVAQQLRRNYVGYELYEHYRNVILTKLQSKAN